MKASDVKAQINERIIKALSEGKIPWLKPWTENGPRNLFSGRGYTGLNRLIPGSLPTLFLFGRLITSIAPLGYRSNLESTDTGLSTQGKW